MSASSRMQFMKTDLTAMKATAKSFPCTACGRRFRSASALSDHNRTVCQKCPVCERRFSTQAAKRQHQLAKEHAYCAECNLVFDQKNTFDTHCRQSHRIQFHCCLCERDFVDANALQQHLADKVHPAKEASASTTCDQCGKTFCSPRSLEQHKNSPVHRPLANLTCVSKKCQSAFNCPSALLHHLESGGCPSGWTRERINMVLHKSDIERVFTTGIISLQSSTPSSALTTPIMTPSTPTLTPCDWSLVDVEEGVRSWSLQTQDSHPLDGTSSSSRSDASFLQETGGFLTIQCSACLMMGIKRTFINMAALQQHLSSAAHDPKTIKCPSAFFNQADPSGKSEVRYFKTLSGMIQHVESGGCVGGQGTLRNMLDYLRVEVLQLEWSGTLLQE